MYFIYLSTLLTVVYIGNVVLLPYCLCAYIIVQVCFEVVGEFIIVDIHGVCLCPR